MLLEETFESRQDMVRMDEVRGQIRRGAGFHCLCLVTGFTRLTTNILQAERTVIEDAEIVTVQLQQSCLPYFVQMETSLMRHPSVSPPSALSADVCTLIRKEPTWAHPPPQHQRPGRENNVVWLFRVCLRTVQQHTDALHPLVTGGPGEAAACVFV